MTLSTPKKYLLYIWQLIVLLHAYLQTGSRYEWSLKYKKTFTMALVLGI